MNNLRKLFCFLGFGLLVQPIIAENCNSLISSCSFENSNPDEGEVKDIIFDAIASTKIKVDNSRFFPIGYRPQWEGATDSVAYVGTVRNPHDVDSNFIDVDKNMLIVHIPSKDKVDYKLMNLFAYQVSGFKPGTEFQMTFTVQAVDEEFEDSFIPVVDLTVGINCSAYGISYVSEVQNIELKIGESQKVTLTGIVPQDMTTLSLDILAGYNYHKGCTFGISDLEITGCIFPKIRTSSRNVCAGEYINLSLDRDYKASSYEWMMKSPEGEFEPVGDRQNLFTELNDLGTYSFYCFVDGLSSDTIDINSQVGCLVNDKPASMKCIFNDDFGYFEDDHIYVDAKGNVQTTPSTFAPMRADADFKIPGHKFDKDSQIEDGTYAVVVPTPNGIALPQDYATWWDKVTKDHTYYETGIDNGAVLFVNVTDNYKGVVYQRTVDGICPGSYIMAESYIGDLGGQGSKALLLIKDAATGDTIAKSEPLATIEKGWTNISIDFTVPENVSSVVIEIESVGENWRKGCDLVIDDVRLYSCSSPSISLFTNLETLETSKTISENESFTLEASVSELLTNYYGGKQLYLFQHSSDMNNWKNVAVASSENTITLETSVFPDTINYFRVVAASESTINDVIENPNIIEDLSCDNALAYSISNVVNVTNLAPQISDTTSISNSTNEARISYYVDGKKLFVNAAEGSNVMITTPLGLLLANKKMESNCIAFELKDQNLVILVVDGIAYKVIVK